MTSRKFQQSFNLIGLISSPPENTCEAFNLLNNSMFLSSVHVFVFLYLMCFWMNGVVFCFSCVNTVLSLPPAGPSGSLLRSGRSQETFLLRLQEANGGKHGAALRRSDQFLQQLNQFKHLSLQLDVSIKGQNKSNTEGRWEGHTNT